MTEIKAIQSLYFSPTGTTRKILSTIETNTDLKPAKPIDITPPKQRNTFNGKVEGDILLVGAPVYHGSPPWPMLEPLNKLKGEGRWAVPVAVYGNRTPETCVEELAKILKDRGFKILAAASFIAEHSIIASNYRIAPGRPDEADMKIIEAFGRQIKEKASNPTEIHLSEKLYNIFTKEHVDTFPQDYHLRALDSLKRLLKREIAEDGCTMCRGCERVCPTDALDIESRKIDEDLCVWCYACARSCPEGVISFRWIDETPAHFEAVDKIFGSRKEPKIYLT